VKSFVFLIAFLAASASRGTSADLSISIQDNPRVLRVGDRAAFTLSFTNGSNRELGIIPDVHLYQASDIDVIKVGGKEKAEVVTYIQQHYDFEGAAKGFRILKPSQTWKRKISATVSSSVPKRDYIKQSPGLYLLFEDSAIRLPGFGQYKVTSRYDVGAFFKQFLKDGEQRSLWIGHAVTPPINIEFRQ
jgi:hypothetical protein